MNEEQQSTPKGEKPVGRPVQEIIADLSKPIAEKHLETRNQGGKDLTYISWHNAVRYLDHFAPGWCSEITRIHSDEKRIYLVARITIPCAEGTFYREATGTEELDLRGYGDPSSNAESMALRRAAAKWGLGLYLYDKGTQQTPANGQQSGHQRPAQNNNEQHQESAPIEPYQPEEGKPNPNVSPDLPSLVSAKQLGMIRAISREAGIDAEEECERLLGCAPAELHKKAASNFIDHLLRIQKKAAAAPTPMRRAS